METLQEILKKLLADVFAMYLKAHNYHWNVEGRNFSQFHEFFGNLYEELHGSVDPIAEEIRALDTYAPGSLSRFKELTEIEDELTIPNDVEMCRRLLADNEKVLTTLNVAFKLADSLDKQGLADFLAGRIDVHNKHAWMLKSIIK
jgi:starvation-inducible DNA-binding protein